jgi:hypothetical protein
MPISATWRATPRVRWRRVARACDGPSAIPQPWSCTTPRLCSSKSFERGRAGACLPIARAEDRRAPLRGVRDHVGNRRHRTLGPLLPAPAARRSVPLRSTPGGPPRDAWVVARARLGSWKPYRSSCSSSSLNSASERTASRTCRARRALSVSSNARRVADVVRPRAISRSRRGAATAACCSRRTKRSFVRRRKSTKREGSSVRAGRVDQRHRDSRACRPPRRSV